MMLSVTNVPPGSERLVMRFRNPASVSRGGERCAPTEVETQIASVRATTAFIRRVSSQREVHHEIDVHRDVLAVLLPRLERPLRQGLHRLFVEAEHLVE